MPVEKAEVERLRRLTRAQLEAISRDFMQPESVQRAARSVLGDLARQRLITAVRSFDDAVPVFVDLTRKLRAITEEARKDPVGDAVSQLTMTIRRFGEVFDKVDDVVHEPPPKAGQELPGEPSPEPDAEIEAGAHAGGQAVVTGAPPPPPDEQPERQPGPPPPEAPATAFANAPPPGAAMNSTRFSEIAPEYVATFQAASIRPERVSAVEHVRRKLMGFAEDYRSVQPSRFSAPSALTR